MNLALYTYTAGNNHAPTGILFHSAPPLLTEIARTALGFSQASSPAGANTVLFAVGKWQNQGDTSALFCIGGDLAGNEGSGQYISRVPGSDGTSGNVGGWHLMWGFPVWAAQTNAGAAGAFIQRTNVSPGPIEFGGFQQSSTSQRNSPYVMDLIQTPNNAPTTGYTIGGECADNSSSSFAYITSSSFSGTGCRWNTLWACCNTSAQTIIGTFPTVQTSWSANTQITQTVINNNVTIPMQFLNVPPIMRVATSLSTAIAANTNVTVPLTGPQLDPLSGFSGNTWVVPVSGVYLVHGIINFNKPTSGDTYAGIRVSGGTIYWGPTHTVSGASITTVRTQVTRMLDLVAGDAISLIAFNSVASSLNNAGPCRLLAKWMAPIAGTSGTVSFTPPDMWFRWQAGMSGGTLPSFFTKYIGNDVNFLLNRPYLIAKQGTAQTGLGVGTWATLQMTPTGLVHSSAGDNYGGWTVAGTLNYYTAQVPGWYLVLVNGTQTSPATPSVHAAGIGYYTSTGAAQGSTTPDVYQIIASNTSTNLPGADAIGLYYLNTGDRVAPMYQEVSGAATWSTTVSAGHQSAFGVVWVSE